MLTKLIIAADAFLLGWLVGWLVFDYQFYQPLRKLLHETFDGWDKSLDMLQKVAQILEPKKNADGSMVSPIQIPPEE